MIASPEIYKDMKALGLENAEPAVRCKKCRGKSHWIHPNRDYCFVCIARGDVKVTYPPGPFKARLKREVDVSRPVVHIVMLNNRQWKIVDDHPVWKGTIICDTEFSELKPARATVELQEES